MPQSASGTLQSETIIVLARKTSVKTGVSPDKLHLRRNLSILKRFSMDKLFKLKQLYYTEKG